MAHQRRSIKISRVENMKVPPRKPKDLFGWRHFQVLLLFLGLTLSYSLRTNMSVAIVAMVDAESANPNYEEFDWDSSTQSVILSSFFWGYIVTQVPAGMIAHRWGAHKLFAISILLCGIVSLLTPAAAHYGGWTAVCGTRIVLGLFQGGVLPMLHTLLAKWIPPEERARLGTFVYAGAQVGTVIALPSSGFLAASSLGWPSVFYVFGAANIAWAILWFFFGKESPADQTNISFDEKVYIEASLGATEVKEPLSTPWKAIMTSLPMWSLIIVHSGQAWGFWMLLTETPTYLKSILGFDIKKNGTVSALPYLAMWILSFPLSFISDYIMKKGYISTATARKGCNTIGHWIPAIALIGLGYVNSDDPVLAVGILVIAVGFNAGTLCGYQVNHMDLSPNFAGTLMGITNGVANIFAILAPLIAGVIVTDSSNIVQWRTVFFISGGIYFLGNLIFILCGSGTIQPWNEPPSNKKTDAESGVKPESSKEKESQKY